MGKRFTDTCKWKDTWFQDLPNKYKLFWIYLLDECDAAGLWKPNMRLAMFQIGEPFEEAELKRVFADRVVITNDGYWFISKFIEFQYGELSENSRPHIAVLKLLDKHNIKGYTKGIHTLKDKDKDKDAPNLIEYGNSEAKHFILITSKFANEPSYRLWGVSGVSEYLQMNGSKWPRTDFADKFLRDKTGQPFNDFGHVLNAYNVYIKNQFK
jgi:hypothetical protein